MHIPLLIIGNKNYSSWSLRPWLTLRQAGIAFTEIRIPLDTPDTAARIAEYSPSGRVPALLHGELRLWESLAICEYAAELRPEAHLWPAECNTRAVARAVSCEMHSGFAELRRGLPMDIRSRTQLPTISAAAQADIARITALWRACRQQYGSSGPFLFGAFTIADAMYAPVATRFRTYGIALDPESKTYCEAILALPTMQEWIAAAEQEVEVLENP